MVKLQFATDKIDHGPEIFQVPESAPPLFRLEGGIVFRFPKEILFSVNFPLKKNSLNCTMEKRFVSPTSYPKNGVIVL